MDKDGVMEKETYILEPCNNGHPLTYLEVFMTFDGMQSVKERAKWMQRELQRILDQGEISINIMDENFNILDEIKDIG